MRKAAVAILVGLAFAPAAMADQYVRGYVRQDGTYVPPHYRSSPDGYRGNNWSTEGNVNPYTGQRGYVPQYPTQPTYPTYQNPYRR